MLSECHFCCEYTKQYYISPKGEKYFYCTKHKDNMIGLSCWLCMDRETQSFFEEKGFTPPELT